MCIYPAYYFESTATGREFGQNVVLALRDKTSKLYQDLSTHLGKDLDDYIMETELQLYINQKDYMVADIVLFKEDKLTGDVLDVLLIENKLSPKSKLTPRQKELFDLVRNN